MNFFSGAQIFRFRWAYRDFGMKKPTKIVKNGQNEGRWSVTPRKRARWWAEYEKYDYTPRIGVFGGRNRENIAVVPTRNSGGVIWYKKDTTEA